MKSVVLHSTAAEAANDVPTAPPTPGSGGTSSNYCQAAPNSQGTTATISFSGSLSLQESTFTLVSTGHTVHPASFGMFTYGTQPTNVPFGNGYLCISPFNPGIFRMPTQALLSPTLALSMESAPGQFQLINPGTTWYFQFWYRDPQAGNSNFNLSDGLRCTFAPAP